MEGMLLGRKILYVGESDALRSAIDNRLKESPLSFEIMQSSTIENLGTLLENNDFVGVITDVKASSTSLVENICELCNECDICAILIVVIEENVEEKGQIPVTEGNSMFIITDQTRFPKAALKATDIIISEVMREESLALRTGWPREHFRSIFENARVGINLVGLDDRIIEVNPEFQDMVGYSEEELKNMTITEVTHPEDLEKDYELLNRMLAEDEDRYQMEKRYITKSGDIVWANLTVTVVRDDNGNPLWTIGIAQDITKQKKTQQELERAFKAMDSSIDGIAILNENREYTYLNDAHADIYGYSRPADLLGLSWKVLYGPEERDRFQQEIMPYLDENGHWKGEAVGRKKNGKEFPQEVSLTLLEDDGLICVVRDISKRKEVEERLRKQREELSEFAHAMSHDLSNRLHQVSGYLDLYHQDHDEEMYRRAQRIISHMGDLLKYSVELADAGQVVQKQSDVDLGEVLMEVASTVLPRTIDYSQEELPTVEADRTKLLQVFRNIFDNAVTHGKPENIKVSEERGNEGIHLQIMNDGKPIPLEHKENLFKRGFTTSPSNTGFGLTIAKKIVEAHGWKISLKSVNPPIFDIFIPKVFIQ
ncbi:MAG: PAS domain S-box protein [Candidatus Lokiarchaeota archaeon]|nr:PAS domain S-box protein [Candidatus Lokiarchaeota archaeon]